VVAVSLALKILGTRDDDETKPEGLETLLEHSSCVFEIRPLHRYCSHYIAKSPSLNA